MEENIDLVIDKKDVYLRDSSTFYIHPERLDQIRFVENKIFASCKILNSPVEHLTSLKLKYVLRKLKPEAKLEIEIFQQVSVMEILDAKQFEANASMAGFKNIQISEDKKTKKLKVNCVRLEDEEDEFEVVVEKNGSVKYLTQSSLKNINKASTFDQSSKNPVDNRKR